MDRIRFAVVGTGWRSLFFVRIAKWLPEQFELTGVLCRTKDRARKYAGEHGVKTFHTMDALLETQPEFVVCCVNKDGIADMAMQLMERGMNVLCETPYAVDRQSLAALCETQQRTGVLLDLAEQYFLYPTHLARHAVLKSGLLGDVISCQLSMMHDYHGISMLRRYLGEENGEVTIRARKTKTPIVATGDRSGYLTGGEIGEEIRTFAHFDYADGRLGIYDFSGTQYHSAIRSNHVRILGTRGEIFDGTVRYLTPDNRPMQEDFILHRDVITGTIRSIDFAGACVFKNPFPADVPMNEDEIAIAQMLLRMARAVRGGERHYPLWQGLTDTLFSILLHQAADEGGAITSLPLQTPPSGI